MVNISYNVVVNTSTVNKQANTYTHTRTHAHARTHAHTHTHTRLFMFLNLKFTSWKNSQAKWDTVVKRHEN